MHSFRSASLDFRAGNAVRILSEPLRHCTSPPLFCSGRGHGRSLYTNLLALPFSPPLFCSGAGLRPGSLHKPPCLALPCLTLPYLSPPPFSGRAHRLTSCVVLFLLPPPSRFRAMPSSRRRPTSRRWHPRYILRQRPRGSGCLPCGAPSRSRRGMSGSSRRLYCRYGRC